MAKQILFRQGNNYRGYVSFEIVGNNEVVADQIIRRCSDRPIKGHYKIEVHHAFGGGDGGWDSYEEEYGIAHGRDELNKRIEECARNYARRQAKRLRAKLVDLTDEKTFLKHCVQKAQEFAEAMEGMQRRSKAKRGIVGKG